MTIDERKGIVWPIPTTYRTNDYDLANVTPEQVRTILRNVRTGKLEDQDRLFRLMLDTWPRLRKALNEASHPRRTGGADTAGATDPRGRRTCDQQLFTEARSLGAGHRADGQRFDRCLCEGHLGRRDRLAEREQCRLTAMLCSGACEISGIPELLERDRSSHDRSKRCEQLSS